MSKPRGEGKWKLTRAQLQDSTENPADAMLMASPRLGSDPVTRPLTNNQGLPADYTTKSEPPTLLLQALQLGPRPIFPALCSTAPFRTSGLAMNSGKCRSTLASPFSSSCYSASSLGSPLESGFFKSCGPTQDCPCPGLLQLLESSLTLHLYFSW